MNLIEKIYFATKQVLESVYLDQIDGLSFYPSEDGGTEGVFWDNQTSGYPKFFSYKIKDRKVEIKNIKEQQEENFAEEVAEFAETETDPADQITAQARPLIQDSVAPWLTTIKNFVDQSASLEEIRDGLVDLYPELDGAAFAEAMGQAIVLADLAGREEVLGADEDIAFAEAIEAAIGGTLDFANPPLFGRGSRASGKKPKCAAGRSHFCQTPNGRGSCVPLRKKCKYPPTGVVQEASDYVEEKVQRTGLERTRADGAVGGGEPATVNKPFSKAKLKKIDKTSGQPSISPTIEEVETQFGKKLLSMTASNDRDIYIPTKSNPEAIEFLEQHWNGKHYSIAWYQRVARDEPKPNYSREEKYRIARTAEKAWKKHIEKIPPGTLISNTPFGGAGYARDRAYRRYGFGKVHSGTGAQYAIVGNNKQLIPIEFDAISYPNRSGDPFAF